ncbi:hypothetical protein HOC13_00565 [Candidatus Woesearchaeota archaeon]|jgi:DNA/RNA endonuclease YhcR with UshA esterase domain|nr:hypothetical protein [Candidatus Woesearchaeota archaeon]
MEENTLKKVSLLVAVLGLLGLWLIASEVDLGVVESIEGVPEGDEVLVKGFVSRVSDVEKVMFLEVENQKVEETTIVLFKDSEIFLEEGDYVEVTGTVEDYNGKKEVIANKVVKK